jgi:hypothetical protein
MLCRYMPRLEASPIAWTKDGKIAIDFTAKLWDFTPLGLDLSYRVRYRVIHHNFTDRNIMLFNLDKTARTDVDELEGYWRAFDVGDQRTILRYRARVDLKWFLPKWVQAVLLRQDVPVAASATAKFIESNGQANKEHLDASCL